MKKILKVSVWIFLGLFAVYIAHFGYMAHNSVPKKVHHPPQDLSPSPAPKSSEFHVWQRSSQLSINFGVRDKYNNGTAYTADFVVYGPEDTVYFHSVEGFGDKFTNSIFPDDYTGFPQNGEYCWQCYVDDKLVMSDSFTYTKFTSQDVLTETLSINH